MVDTPRMNLRSVVQNLRYSGFLENYAFAWRLTGEERWFRQARRWFAGRLRLGAGRQVVEVLPVFPEKMCFTAEEVPFAPSGLAAGSLKYFAPQANQSATRVLASAGEEDCLVLAFVPRSVSAEFEHRDGGLALRTKSTRFDFERDKGGRGILVRS